MEVDEVIPEKKLLKKLLWAYHTFRPGKKKKIRYDLENTGDEITHILYSIIKDVASKTDEEPQADCFREPLEIGLFTSAKDTAYQDQRNYALWLILNKYYNQLQTILIQEKKDNDFTNPENWHCNRWYHSKQTTQELRKKGIIKQDWISPEEIQFVNEKHTEDVKNYVKQKNKKKGGIN